MAFFLFVEEKIKLNARPHDASVCQCVYIHFHNAHSYILFDVHRNPYTIVICLDKADGITGFCFPFGLVGNELWHLNATYPMHP